METNHLTLEHCRETFLFQDYIMQFIKLLKQIHPSTESTNIANHFNTCIKNLISNSSDALDRIKFSSLSDSSVLKSEPELFIKINLDLESKTLDIIDSGMGMSKNDLVMNLGCYRSKRMKLFVDVLKEDLKDETFEQFGGFFGFHSAFMYADKVRVTSKMNESDQYIWESNGNDTFTIEKDTSSEILTRGTRVTLYLNENILSILEDSSLQRVLINFSKSITYRVLLGTKKENNELVWNWLNKNKPLWTRNPDTISKIEYVQFYKEISNDWDDYLTVSQHRFEGQLDMSILLFIPKIAHFNCEPVSHLYIRRIFIMNNCKYIIPEYLYFMRVLVDSDDLPLNIRGFYENKILKVISKRVSKLALQMIERLIENKEEVNNFFQNFGRQIKLGVVSDTLNRLVLINLLRFHSNISKKDWVSLREYCSRMKVKHIFSI